jgi:hypothetical protein
VGGKLSGDPGVAQWWDADVNPGASLQLHRQGQHPLPHHHLAGHVDRLQRRRQPPEPALRRAANEYLNLGGGKFSTSRGNVIGWNTVLAQFQPDAWRYVLTAMAPESADVEFTWQDFMDRINNELVANWGNLVNRMLGFAYKRFEGNDRADARCVDRRRRRLPGEIKAASPASARSTGGQAQGGAARSAPPEPARQPISQRPRAVEDNRRGAAARGDRRLCGAAGHRLAQADLGADPAAQQRSRCTACSATTSRSLVASTPRKWRTRAAPSRAALRSQQRQRSLGKPARCRRARRCASQIALFIKLDEAVMAEKLGIAGWRASLPMWLRRRSRAAAHRSRTHLRPAAIFAAPGCTCLASSPRTCAGGFALRRCITPEWQNPDEPAHYNNIALHRQRTPGCRC